MKELTDADAALVDRYVELLCQAALTDDERAEFARLKALPVVQARVEAAERVWHYR